MYLHQILSVALSLWASTIPQITASNIDDQPLAAPSNPGAQAAAPSSMPSSGPSPPYGNASSPSTSSTGNQGNGAMGSQQVWVVRVGSPDGKFVFSPNTIQGQPGDLVQFQFYARVSYIIDPHFCLILTLIESLGGLRRL
jgi:hypothetical protein